MSNNKKSNDGKTPAGKLPGNKRVYEDIIVETYKEGGKMHVRPEAGQKNLDTSLNVEFPKDLRKGPEGRRFKINASVSQKHYEATRKLKGQPYLHASEITELKRNSNEEP